MTLALVAAVSMPAHARVNTRCYMQWNGDRDDLMVVWAGTAYSDVFSKQFNEEPRGRNCDGDECVQRVWCTDSGVAGWYMNDGDDKDVELTAVWLEDRKQSTEKLKLTAKRGLKKLRSTNENGPGTVVVLGDVLFYYAFVHKDDPVAFGTPHLTAIRFHEWAQVGKLGRHTVLVDGYDVTGYTGKIEQNSKWSPIYAAGPDTVTVSFEPYYGQPDEGDSDDWAVDFVLSLTGDKKDPVARGPRVHYETDGKPATPSVKTISREVLTLRRYTCRAFTDGRPVRCHAVGDDEYTWSTRVRSVLGMRFGLLTEGFDLPASLWLLDGAEYEKVFRPLVSGGTMPLIWLDDRLRAVESLPDTSCASGHRLFLVERMLPRPTEIAREQLHCEWRQTVPEGDDEEPAWAAAAVKWVPWVADSQLFVAADLNRSRYWTRGEADVAGEASREHILEGERGALQIPSDRAPLGCPANNEGAVSVYHGAAAASAEAGLLACVRAMIADEVSATDVINGSPLVSYAATAEIALLLVERGANIEAKGVEGRTALITVAREENDVQPLLDAGAAVCTKPDNAFEHYVGSDNQRALEAAVMTAPCEPGWWLAPGDECEGLTPCAPGHFCPGYNDKTNEQRPCPAGTYGPKTRAVSAEQCQPCPAERPNSAPGSARVDECSSGGSALGDAAAASAGVGATQRSA